MPSDNLVQMLFVSASEKYGDKYIEHLLEQYKIYIAGIEKISDRRQKANEFFLALNAALVTILGFVISKQTQGDHVPWVFIAIYLVLIMAMVFWRSFLH